MTADTKESPEIRDVFESQNLDPRGASSPSGFDEAFRRLLTPLHDQLQAFDNRLTVLEGHRGEQREMLSQQLAEVIEGVRQIVEQSSAAVEGQLARIENQLEEPEDQPQESFMDQWEAMILGSDLLRSENVAPQRKQLLEAALAGDAKARLLAGSIMLVASATAEQLPQLIANVGEAFYSWHPKEKDDSSPLEQDLVDGLGALCQSVGLNNTIDLVSLDDRFDSRRHQPTGEGTRVTDVHGWIVLRENSKVFNRAKVDIE